MLFTDIRSMTLVVNVTMERLDPVAKPYACNQLWCNQWARGTYAGAKVLNSAPQLSLRTMSARSKPGTPVSDAYGLAVAGDGSVWWAEDEIDKMARVDSAAGEVEEFTIPDVGGHAFPRRMNTEANGDLWVALQPDEDRLQDQENDCLHAAVANRRVDKRRRECGSIIPKPWSATDVN